MLLLLDGYNILKKIERTKHITEAERRKFIKKLNNYAHKKKISIVLVFDSGISPWPLHEKVSTYVTVTYSGTSQTADDYIKTYLETHSTQEIILVSSDRELVKEGRHYNIPSLDSYEFAEYLLSFESPLPINKRPLSQTHHKITTKDTSEIDTLMAQLNPITKDDDQEKQPLKQKKLSKEERKIMQKIKKL